MGPASVIGTPAPVAPQRSSTHAIAERADSQQTLRLMAGMARHKSSPERTTHHVRKEAGIVLNGTLSKYRFVAELGRGGMGTVHLAIARGPARFNKVVVIKQLNSALAEDPHFTGMFLEEARLAARLQHPKIVQTNEVVCDPDGYFIVMEYIEGVSLWRLLRRLRARVDTPTQGSYVRSLYIRAIVDVLAALEYAHALRDFDGTPLNIIHRDVNPANVVIGYDGQVKLIDFGIAKAADTSDQTKAGIVKGKIHYLSPEAVAGDPIDRRTDVFAAGAMLWDALAGQRLWHAMHAADIEHALFRGAVPSPRSVNPQVPEELEAICMKAVAGPPADRYSDAAVFRADLERVCRSDLASTEALSASMSSEFLEERERMLALLAERLQRADDDWPIGRPVPAALGSMPTGDVGGSSGARSTPDEVAADIVDARLGPRAVRRRMTLRASSTAGLVAACLLAVAATLAVRSASKSAHTESSQVHSPLLAKGPVGTASTPTVEEVAPAIAVATMGVTTAPAVQAESSVKSPIARSSPTRRRAAPAPHGASDPSSMSSSRPRDPGRSAAGALGLSAPGAEAVPHLVDDHGASGAAAPPATSVAATSPAPAPSGGMIPASQQKAVTESHRAEIQSCWYRARMEQPFLDVRVSIAATVASDGRVSDVASSANEAGTTRLQACIRDAVRAWVFPPPTGGSSAHLAIVFE
jgi:serine/threonine protein kinase